jgi:tetratricopeptide (TPR) repeat protein
MRRDLRTAGALALAALAAACAQQPVAPVEDDEPLPPRVVRLEGPREDAVRRHRDLAREAQRAGDLATAADHLHVVAMLADDDGAKRDADSLRQEVRRLARDAIEAGRAAQRAGDSARASASFLRALALEPRNAEAARALREIDRQNMARAQASRASRIRVEDLFADARAAPPAAAAPAAAPGNDAYDVDQRLAMLSAGDTAGALRELKAWVDAHPKDRASRQRIGAAVAERARELDGKGQREAALGMYEQALALRGEPQAEWSARVAALRKSVGAEYYSDGVRLMRTDLNGAIKAFETSVRYDPQNANAQSRLRDAKAARAKLSRIPAR